MPLTQNVVERGFDQGKTDYLSSCHARTDKLAGGGIKANLHHLPSTAFAHRNGVARETDLALAIYQPPPVPLSQ
jgi:hypothetical protein